MKIKTIHRASTEQVAPGFSIRRGLPAFDIESVGPFLLLDHLGPRILKPGEGQGVPDHPHKGFQTVTYLIDGKVEHRDSFQNHGIVGPGEVQWMTAGSGIVHSEYIEPSFKSAGGVLHGFQLWVNLPMKHKHLQPGYQHITADRFPVVKKNDGKVYVKIIAGELDDVKSSIQTWSPLFLFHVHFDEASAIELPLQLQMESALYIASGSVRIDGSETLTDGQTVFFGDGGSFMLSSEGAADLLFFGGVPLQEPVATYGPFVMNYPAEIREAILEYQSGKFGTITI